MILVLGLYSVLKRGKHDLKGDAKGDGHGKDAKGKRVKPLGFFVVQGSAILVSG